MTANNNSAADVIRRAEEHLQTARFGLEDMRSRPERFQSGLHNAVVFGRAVTFALQNMRSVVPDFDEWYEPVKVAMKSDPLIKYLSDLRTEIEKTVGRYTTLSGTIKSFNSATDMRHFEPRPPRATSFFIGDQNGGSGWKVANSDGSEDTYYVTLPPEIGEITIHLSKAPGALSEVPAQDLVAEYLGRLGKIVADAKRHFLC